MSTLEAIMERQRKKAVGLKARDEAQTNPTSQQNAEDAAGDQVPKVPLKEPTAEPVAEPISSEEAPKKNQDLLTRKRF